MARMTLWAILFALLAIPASAQGLKRTQLLQQQKEGVPPMPKDCNTALEQARKLITKFQVEFYDADKFRVLGDSEVASLYASSLKSLATTAHHLTDRLMACSVVEQQSNTSGKSSENDDFGTLGVALDEITTFGDMYNWTPPDDESFPSALVDVAPACKPIIAAQLPERIEKALGSPGAVPSESEVSSLADGANPSPNAGLPVCAAQAYKAGYVGAAWRLLSDQTLLSTATLVISTNENLSLEKALGSPANGTIRIQRGPSYCTGTVVNWGWEKTIDWNCF